MRNLIFYVTLLALSNSSLSEASECKCYSQPFKPDPPCLVHCTTRLLAIADLKDLTDFFKLRRETADAVLRVQQRVSSPEQDLLRLLSEDHGKEVKEALEHVSDERLLEFITAKADEHGRDQPFIRELVASIPRDAHESPLAEPSKTAQEALQRAIEAGKLAEGKLLYEEVLTDDKVKFGFDASDLSPEAKAALDEFASQIASENRGVYLEIQGHTDNIGSAKYNEELGLLRAEAVRRYLSQKHGFPLHRINVISYGESAPVADSSTRETQSQNRRVAIVVLR